MVEVIDTNIVWFETNVIQSEETTFISRPFLWAQNMNYETVFSLITILRWKKSNQVTISQNHSTRVKLLLIFRSVAMEIIETINESRNQSSNLRMVETLLYNLLTEWLNYTGLIEITLIVDFTLK